jgi:hypothetical protein
MRRPLRMILWLISERTIAHDYLVGYATDEASLAVAQARLEAALNLLAATRPRWLRRMRGYVSRIQVRSIITSVAVWHVESEQVDFDQAYLGRPDLPIAHIASTLVHEFTHARIDAAGVPYTAANRIRVERACIAQEIGFVQSLPEDAAQRKLLDGLVQQSAQAHEVWSDAANDRRWRQAAQTVGIPPWLFAGLWRIRQLRNRWRAAA